MYIWYILLHVYDYMMCIAAMIITVYYVFMMYTYVYTMHILLIITMIITCICMDTVYYYVGDGALL